MISSSEDCAFKEIPSSKYDKWIQKMKEHLPTSATVSMKLFAIYVIYIVVNSGLAGL